jgi:multidrug efflux pump subunit AcrA (membrane-fusion protein)
MSKVVRGINIHSEQVQDILGSTPPWLIRWGSLSLFSVLIIFFLLAAFLKYPTIIKGELKLTTEHLPVKVVTKVPGRIEKIYVLGNTSVKPGDKLALIENPLSSESIEFLQTVVKKTYSFLEKDGEPTDFAQTTMPLGYLQVDYNALSKKINEYHFFKNNEYYTSKIKALKDQMIYTANLKKIADTQLVLNNAELTNNEEKFKVQKGLFESQVISRLDFLDSENTFIKQKQENENLKRRIQELNISSLDSKKQLEDLTFELKQRELEFRESIKLSLRSIESAVVNWSQNYLLKSPIEGKPFVMNNIIEKQHVNMSDAIFMIVPSIQKYVCLIDISSRGFGKIKKGQRVRIKLDNYPFHEFGQLSGKVVDIPQLPIDLGTTDSKQIFYRIRVEVDQDSKTNYNKVLPFKPEMPGTGEVITEEQTLLQRIFYKVRGSMES